MFFTELLGILKGLVSPSCSHKPELHYMIEEGTEKDYSGDGGV